MIFGNVSIPTLALTWLNRNRNIAWRDPGALSARRMMLRTNSAVFPLRDPPANIRCVAGPERSFCASCCFAVRVNGFLAGSVMPIYAVFRPKWGALSSPPLTTCDQVGNSYPKHGRFDGKVGNQIPSSSLETLTNTGPPSLPVCSTRANFGIAYSASWCQSVQYLSGSSIDLSCFWYFGNVSSQKSAIRALRSLASLFGQP